MEQEQPQRSRSDRAHESEADRRFFNIFMMVFFVVIAGIGIWLANALVDARKADDCIAQGRRNCVPIDVPSRFRE